jgi:hypothetical protein
MVFSIGDFIVLLIFLISFSVFASKPVPLYLKLFPLYFFILLIANLVIEYTTPRGIHNSIISNSSGIGEFALYFYAVRSVVDNPRFKKAGLYLTIGFVVFAVINLIFQKDDRFNPINYTVGVVLTVALCIYYFIGLFQKHETQSLKKITGFWIVSGIFCNVILGFPMYVSISFMGNTTSANQKMMTVIFDHLEAIYNIINVLSYSLYTVGFLGRIRTASSISRL